MHVFSARRFGKAASGALVAQQQSAGEKLVVPRSTIDPCTGVICGPNLRCEGGICVPAGPVFVAMPAAPQTISESEAAKKLAEAALPVGSREAQRRAYEAEVAAKVAARSRWDQQQRQRQERRRR
jgi:hypothetical protein